MCCSILLFLKEKEEDVLIIQHDKTSISSYSVLFIICSASYPPFPFLYLKRKGEIHRYLKRSLLLYLVISTAAPLWERTWHTEAVLLKGRSMSWILHCYTEKSLHSQDQRRRIRFQLLLGEIIQYAEGLHWVGWERQFKLNVNQIVKYVRQMDEVIQYTSRKRMSFFSPKMSNFSLSL